MHRSGLPDVMAYKTVLLQFAASTGCHVPCLQVMLIKLHAAARLLTMSVTMSAHGVY